MFRGMSRPIPSASALSLFCILALQLQLWSSLTMSCAHQGSTAAAGDAYACPLHSTESSIAGSEGGSQKAEKKAPIVLDCQKCVLALALGACLQADVPLPLVTRTRPVATGIAEKHFYAFVPDALDRPPIRRQT